MCKDSKNQLYAWQTLSDIAKISQHKHKDWKAMYTPGILHRFLNVDLAPA